MPELKLYDYPLSGNCYKIRLMLSMLGLDYEKIPTDILAGDTLSPEFKQINPRAQIPVLVDGDELLWDSMAILIYLARRYGDERWLPRDPLAEARVMQWMAVSENEVLYGIARARAALWLKRPFDLEQCHRDAHAGLTAMEARLSNEEWLAGDEATIADVACYTYVSLAHEGKISLANYPGVRAWLKRVESLRGWEKMTSATT